MVETRAQALQKGAAARDSDSTTVNRIEGIEKALALQNEKTSQLDESMKTLIEAVNLMTTQIQWNIATNGEFDQREGGEGFIHDRQGAMHHHHQGYRMTRMAKINFPKFDGSKLKEWLSKAEEFFAIDNTREESKVGIASIHFEGEASTWHLALKQEAENAVVLRNWRVYKNRLKQRFEEVLDDPMAELKELK